MVNESVRAQERSRPQTLAGTMLLVAVVALGIRLALLGLFGTQYTPEGDDAIYREMGLGLLRDGTLLGEGKVPPLYPLLLAGVWAIAGADNIQAAVLVQLLLGTLIALLWAGSAWLMLRSRGAALAAGLLSALDLPLASLGLRLLTETLTAFFLALVIFSLLWFQASDFRATRRLLICGLAAGLLSVTRSQYAALCAVPLIVLLYHWVRGRRSALRYLAFIPLMVLPTALLLGAVVERNSRVNGYATISTMTGSYLSNTICAGVQYAPDSYEPLKSIYLKHRQANYEQWGHCAMTIARARDEMMATTGLTLPQLSRRLQALSLDTIKAQPNVYIRSVFTGSLMTIFDVPTTAGSNMLRLLFVPVHYGLVLLALVALGVALGRLGLLADNERRAAIVGGMLLMLGSFSYTVLTSALFEFGEGGRYRYPATMALYLLLVMGAWLLRVTGLQLERASVSGQAGE